MRYTVARPRIVVLGTEKQAIQGEYGSPRTKEGRMRTPVAALALVGAMEFAPAPVLAQAPPMDMSWAMQSQTYLWNRGNAAAMAAGQACYNALLRLRMQGYRGPADCGANQQTLQNSINRLNQAQQSYIQNSMANSWRTHQAIGNWDMGAIRGCSWGVDWYGRRVWVCP
jgi:hypothetical protein